MSKYLETLNQVFDESGFPSKEKVLGLMDETLSFFKQIQTKMKSGDPAAQKAAFEETLEMKRILEAKMQALTEKTGLDLRELAALSENPDNMSSEERTMLDAAKAKLERLQEDSTKKINNSTTKIIG